MNLAEKLKIIRNEIGVSNYIPVTHFNSPTVMESENGMIFSVIKVKGIAFDTENDDVLNQLQQTWHNAIMTLDDRFCIYVTIHRRRENIELSGQFDNDFARYLDKQYHSQFRSKHLFVNDIFIIVTYKGITTSNIGKGIRLLNYLSDRIVKESREINRQSQMRQLQKAVKQLMVSLSRFEVRLLGQDDCKLGYSELLNFLGRIVNGGESSQFKYTSYASPIKKTFTQTLKSQSLYPQGNIAHYVSTKRLFFGEYIQFQGASKNDVTFGAIITIKRYGTESASIMLDSLLQLECEFISTHSFALEMKDIADKNIRRHIIKMENTNDPAVSQIQALTGARDQLASDKIAMGYHHNTVMLLADTPEELEENVSQAIKCYLEIGFVAVRETLGQEPAFWAQIPTNLKYIARSSLISSKNFTVFPQPLPPINVV